MNPIMLYIFSLIFLLENYGLPSIWQHLSFNEFLFALDKFFLLILHLQLVAMVDEFKSW